MYFKLHYVPILVAFVIVGIASIDSGRIQDKLKQWKNQCKTAFEKSKLLYFLWRRIIYKRAFEAGMRCDNLTSFADTIQLILDKDTHSLMTWLKSGKDPKSFSGRALNKLINNDRIIPVINELKTEFKDLHRDSDGRVIL